MRQVVNGVTTSMAFSASDAPCWSYVGTSSNGCANAPSGATTYGGDANGNHTSSSAGAALSYNARNQTTSMNHLELATLGWVHWFNEERLHSHCGDVPPAEFEAAFYAGQQPALPGLGNQ